MSAIKEKISAVVESIDDALRGCVELMESFRERLSDEELAKLAKIKARLAAKDEQRRRTLQ